MRARRVVGSLLVLPLVLLVWVALALAGLTATADGPTATTIAGSASGCRSAWAQESPGPSSTARTGSTNGVRALPHAHTVLATTGAPKSQLWADTPSHTAADMAATVTERGERHAQEAEDRDGHAACGRSPPTA